MTPKPEPIHYTPLQPDPPTTPTPTYVILPYYPRRNHRTTTTRNLLLLSLPILLLLSLSTFLLYPSNPTLKLVRVELYHIRVNSSLPPSLSLSLSLTLRVRNRDFFSLDYRSLTVAIAYRGRELGFVRSNGGEVRARGSSYVDATLVVDGFEVLHDVIYLIEDFAAGSVPFDAVSSVDGDLGLFFFKIPIQAKISCDVYVNPMNQTIINQNCYAK